MRPLPLLVGAVGGLALARAAVAVGRAARGVLPALGASSAALRARANTSPHAVGGRFTNTEPGSVVAATSTPMILWRILTKSKAGHPSGPVPLVPGAPDQPPAAAAATWFGHASVLLEVDGHRLLTDPMWSERASPSRTRGPRRLHPVPTSLSRLPPLDAVLISHDHYDHLDLQTITALVELGDAPFVVPVGVGAHLRRWGVPAARVVELDWGAATRIGDLTLTCVETRHFSGRGRVRNTTQWAAWAVAGPNHNVYFGGDTGYTTTFARTGAEQGPFDLTVLPIGAYADIWPDIHMNPEDAVRAHRDLRGELMLPVHWATFDLGFHPWAEPAQRLGSAAAIAGVRVVIPRPGERINIDQPGPIADWWSRLS